MWNRLIVFLLLLCVTSTYLSRDFAVVSFDLNQKFISEKMCENRDKPWMHCNGRCYLMKKVKQAEENEKKQASKELRSSMQVLFYSQPHNPLQRADNHLELARRYKIHYHYFYTSQYNASVFRPPKSAATA